MGKIEVTEPVKHLPRGGWFSKWKIFLPSSPEAFERLGLFYPKIPQRIVSGLLDNVNTKMIGEEFARLYLKETETWHIRYKTDLLYFLKTFIVFVSGCETAQRVLDKEVLFIVMDINKVYKGNIIKDVIISGVSYLREKVGFNSEVNIRFENIIPGHMGRYYCAKCGMFFEFDVSRNKATCPLMGQKCMFDPKNVEAEASTVEDLTKIYKITPYLYKEFIKKLPQARDKVMESLHNAVDLFVDDVNGSGLRVLAEGLGINEN